MLGYGRVAAASFLVRHSTHKPEKKQGTCKPQYNNIALPMSNAMLLYCRSVVMCLRCASKALSVVLCMHCFVDVHLRCIDNNGTSQFKQTPTGTGSLYFDMRQFYCSGAHTPDHGPNDSSCFFLPNPWQGKSCQQTRGRMSSKTVPCAT